jgi:hypothetical protein
VVLSLTAESKAAEARQKAFVGDVAGLGSIKALVRNSFGLVAQRLVIKLARDLGCGQLS